MEIIKYTSYQGLAPHWKLGQELPVSGTVYVAMEDISDFFLLLERTQTDNKYVLITSCSDYSVVEQETHPVWRDLPKWLQFVKIDHETGYNSLYVPARVNPERCKITDKYSLKVYSFTNWTFERIPPQVKVWFSTNCDIDDPRVRHIPFGIPDWSHDMITEARAKGLHLNDNREIAKYSNFQLNNLLRVAIKRSEISANALNEDNVPHEQFVDRLLNSQFVLSPSGNGLDGYRSLEAIYSKLPKTA